MPAADSRSECASTRVGGDVVDKAAEVVWRAFLAEGKRVYGPVDKLGLATSSESLLAALYEVERGVRAELGEELGRELAESFYKVVAAIASDARSKERRCLEEAVKLAHELAVKSLARLGR